ncbi:hypothetical protein [Microbacterium indicum]|uniref:hypothetical protein n=1 Tax=Microbacterium indicum TaxID=358100 RepID=UPI00040B7671|nr:hypothetical protein [Microbacterium indicum]
MSPAPATPAPPLAYAVPWHVTRDGPHPLVTNASAEPLEHVRALLTDATPRVAHEPWGLVLPGEEVEICLCDFEEASAAVVLSWFRTAGDEEYLWRFVL